MDDPKVGIAFAVGKENNFAPVGRPIRQKIVSGMVGELTLGSALAVKQPKLQVSAPIRVIDDLLPVG